MAATLVLLDASPNALKYVYTHDAAGSSSVSLTQAQLIADANTAGPGPSALAALLAATQAADWDTLPRTKQFSLMTTMSEIPAAGTCVAARFIIGPNRLLCAGVDANAAVMIVELRFNTTPSR